MKNSIDYNTSVKENVSIDPRLLKKLKPVEKEMAETDLQLSKKINVINEIDNTRSEFDTAWTDWVFSFQDVVLGKDWDDFFDMICNHEQNIGNHAHPEYKDVSWHLSYDQKNQIKVLIASKKAWLQLEIDQLKVKKDILCEKHNMIMVEFDQVEMNYINSYKNDSKYHSLDKDLKNKFHTRIDEIWLDSKYNAQEEFVQEKEQILKDLLSEQIFRNSKSVLIDTVNFLSETYDVIIDINKLSTDSFKDISESFMILYHQISFISWIPNFYREFKENKTDFIDTFTFSLLDYDYAFDDKDKRLIYDKIDEFDINIISYKFWKENIVSLKESLKNIATDFSSLDKNVSSTDELIKKIDYLEDVTLFKDNIKNSTDLAYLYYSNHINKIKEIEELKEFMLSFKN